MTKHIIANPEHKSDAEIAREAAGIIPLSRGATAKVDLLDYKFLKQFQWHLTSHGRAARSENHKTIYMHRDVAKRMGIDGLVDHANHDPLDNRRTNLRPCNRVQNNTNRRKPVRGTNGKPPTSIYKGVHQRYGKWAATLTVHGKKVWLGHHDTEEAAARARDAAAVELHGEFVVLNFTPPRQSSNQTV